MGGRGNADPAPDYADLLSGDAAASAATGQQIGITHRSA
jgi:hypothetical protein